MGKHTLIHLKKDCISCGACAAITPDYWEMDEEGLAHLKGSKAVNAHFELEINTEEARAENQEAANCCPVSIIKVEKKA
ncbi:MAG TPA: ferredoxin [Candidatus Nanoarchaeia archaeon]|nr:ferredoxin [Candidatus Nanoarchaeia archaeon]